MAVQVVRTAFVYWVEDCTARSHLEGGKCQMIVLSKLFFYARHNRALIGVSLDGNSTAKIQIKIVVLESLLYKILTVKVYFIIFLETSIIVARY